MDDPLVVDTFIRINTGSSAQDPRGPPPPKVIADIARGMEPPVSGTEGDNELITTDHSERLLFYTSLLTNIPGQVGSGDIAELSCTISVKCCR